MQSALEHEPKLIELQHDVERQVRKKHLTITVSAIWAQLLLRKHSKPWLTSIIVQILCQDIDNESSVL